MERIDVGIIGAGVIGLAVANEIASREKNIYIFEQNESFGQEASSRNSEVIHAGIYYENHSLKAATCVEGNRLLYELCRENKIPHRKISKVIVAVDESEVPMLEALYEKAKRNAACDIKIITKKELAVLEPNVEAAAAIYSPRSGIIDTHSFMDYLYRSAKEKGAEFVFKAEVVSIVNSGKDGYEIKIKDASGEIVGLRCAVVINSAGLNSDRIAEMAGIDIKKQGYPLRYCKGDYFSVAPKKSNLISRLVYPIPRSTLTGLGIHATLDMGSSLRLGPNAYYIDRNDANYKVDETRRDDFYDSVKKFLPFLEPSDLSPERSGIRAKLQGPGEGFRDFIIKEETKLGFSGFINLIGIESPGLTSALSIAKIVKKLIRG
ncbi:MAG: NAD(P)/FAD-dependent oxidoreductase [Candidatus Omnitrophota bacterium]